MHNDDQVQMSGSIKFASAGPPLQGDMSMLQAWAVFWENIGYNYFLGTSEDDNN